MFQVFIKMDSVVSFFERLFKSLGVRFFQNAIVKTHPTIRFHRRHGKNIKVDASLAVAHRSTDYQHGIVFSQRPVEVNEPICLKILKRNSRWNGPLCFGFTDIDPALLRSEELERAQTLYHRYWHRFWFHGVYSEHCSYLTFSMKDSGDVVFRVDDEDEIVIPREEVQMNTSYRLWAVVDIYGSFSSIQLVYHPALMSSNSSQSRSQSLRLNSESGSSDYDSTGSDDYSEDHRVTGLRTDRPTSPAQLFTFDIQIPNIASSTIPSSPFYNSPEDLASPATTYSTPTSPGHCVICLDEAANTAFVDCGHLCICMECVNNYWESQMEKEPSCPVCRKTVRSYLRIY